MPACKATLRNLCRAGDELRRAPNPLPTVVTPTLEAPLGPQCPHHLPSHSQHIPGPHEKTGKPTRRYTPRRSVTGLTDDPRPGRVPVQCLAHTVVSHWMSPPAFSFPSPFLTFGEEELACLLVKDGPRLPVILLSSRSLVSSPEPSASSSSCAQCCPSLSDILFLTFHHPLPYQRLKTCFYQGKYKGYHLNKGQALSLKGKGKLYGQWL